MTYLSSRLARLDIIPDTCPGCGWTNYRHDHDDAEDGPRVACCDHLPTCAYDRKDTTR